MSRKEERTIVGSLLFVLGCIVLVSEIAVIILSAFDPRISRGKFCEAIYDTSGFVTVLSAAVVFLGLTRRKRHIPSIIVFIANIVCVNRLYSNRAWLEIWETLLVKGNKFLTGSSTENIFLIVVFAGIVIVMIHALYTDLREKTPHITEDGTAADGKNDTNEKYDVGSAMRSVMLKLSMGWVIAAVIYYFLNETGLPGMGLSKENAFVLYAGGIVAMALLIVLEMGEQDHAKGTDRAVSRLSLVFTVAIAGAILCAYLNGASEEEKAIPGLFDMDGFLDSVVDNRLVGAIIILLVLVIIIHCAIKTLMALILHDKKNKLRNEVSKRVRRIEKNLIRFVGELFLNFTKLLLFLPDFFATIGSVLLGKKFFDSKK